MKLHKLFPSRCVRPAELEGREVRVTMTQVKRENFSTGVGKSTSRPVLYFRKRKQGMILHPEQAAVIARSYGDETDCWSGRDIILSPSTDRQCG